MKKLILLSFTLTANLIFSQKIDIPNSYSNIGEDEIGLYLQLDDERFYDDETKPAFKLEQLFGNPRGSADGVELDFSEFEGSITYGLIPYGQAPHPLPVFRFEKTLVEGKVSINIKDNFKYPYDFVDWQNNQKLSIGYRLTDPSGMIVFDGEISLKGNGPFEAVAAIYEGPFINKLTDSTATIWFNTTLPIETEIHIDNRVLKSPVGTHHEIDVKDLNPASHYDYKIVYDDFNQEYHLKTAPRSGSRTPFVFAYTSDSRHATGGGERKIYGANGYIMKKIAAVAYANDAAFIQFSGDVIDGYLETNAETQLQYTNWKKAVEPER